jgi:hypothetical protein
MIPDGSVAKYRFGSVTHIRYEAHNTVETWFPDGAKLVAAFRNDPAVRAHADRVGMSTRDLWRTHDLFHCYLALQTQPFGYSETLWRLAHGLELDPDATGFEEAVVEALQRFAATGFWTEYLRVLPWLGQDLHTVRKTLDRLWHPGEARETV